MRTQEDRSSPNSRLRLSQAAWEECPDLCPNVFSMCPPDRRTGCPMQIGTPASRRGDRHSLSSSLSSHLLEEALQMTLGTVHSPLSDVHCAESPLLKPGARRVNQARTVALTVLLVTVPLSLAAQLNMGTNGTPHRDRRTTPTASVAGGRRGRCISHRSRSTDQCDTPRPCPCMQNSAGRLI